MLERLGVDFFLGIVGLASEFTPKVCSGHTGPDWKKSMPLVRWSSWVPRVPFVSVTSGVGADFVSSSMIPGVLALRVDLLWVLWDWLWSSHPSSAQDIGPDWKELVPLVRQSSTFDFSTETLKYRRA